MLVEQRIVRQCENTVANRLKPKHLSDAIDWTAGQFRRLRDGDLIEIVIDTRTLDGSVNFIEEGGAPVGVDAASRMLEARAPRQDLAADPALPDDTRLWAALQHVSGGTWGGCVYDADAIERVIDAGRRVLSEGK